MMRKKLYCCGVHYQHEMEYKGWVNHMYETIEELKQHSQCWQECGIVEVTAYFKLVKWIEPQDITSRKK